MDVEMGIGITSFRMAQKEANFVGSEALREVVENQMGGKMQMREKMQVQLQKTEGRKTQPTGGGQMDSDEGDGNRNQNLYSGQALFKGKKRDRRERN